ncbi:MAG: hypothetical protein R2716_01515 [Microthrixaceae bacterium]
MSSSEREHLVEAELNRSRPNRALLDRNRIRRAAELRQVLRASVFAPDDLELVKGPPGVRRGFLDDLLVMLHPRNDAVRSDWEKALRQRNALLKQVGGRLDEAASTTLEVWDSKASAAGTQLSDARDRLVSELLTAVQQAYEDVAGRGEPVALHYQRTWGDDLAAALVSARRDDLRRGVSTVGPHRDELVVALADRPRAPTAPRASSAAWPSPCAWPRTGWSPGSTARPRCCCSTTCSASWIRTGRGAPGCVARGSGPALHRRDPARGRRIGGDRGGLPG